MRTALALLSFGIATGASVQVHAEGGPSQAQVAALVAAITKAGCQVTDANQTAVLKDAGLTPDEGAAVVVRLIDKGRLHPYPNDVLKLTGGGCP